MALTGNLEETSLTDLIQFYSNTRQTAAVTISAGTGADHVGIVYVEGGDVTDAQFDDLRGIEAVHRALQLKEGEFSVELNVRCDQRTILEPWSKLVLQDVYSDDAALDLAIAGLVEDKVLSTADTAPVEPRKPISIKTGPPPPPKEISNPPAPVRKISNPGQGSAPPRAISNPGQGSAPPRATSNPGQGSTPPRPMSNPSLQPVPPRPVSQSVLPIASGSRSTSQPSLQPIQSRPASQPSMKVPPLAKTQPPPSGYREEMERSRRKRPPGVGIAVAVLVLAIIAAAVVFLRKGDDQTQTAPAVAQVAPAPKPPPPAAPPVQGVTDSEITFGISAPFSGPARELGREMKVGIDVAFAAANDQGGINGRKLRLVAYDDGYEPERTRLGMKELDEQKKVFGFVGNVGTPTAEVAMPYAVGRKMLFFGAFTGAGLLRHEPPDRYVFNYRASYAEETAATVKYLIEVRRVRPTDIAVFAQQDGFGDAGYGGVVKMLRRYSKRNADDPLRVGYKRNTVDVSDAVDAILAAKHVHAVIMVATYKAAAKFIERLKPDQPEMIFTNVSFVGSTALAEELVGQSPKMAEGVIVTQVVPLPESRSTAVLKYQELLPKYSLGEKPEFISLEGYMVGNLLIEGLRRAGRALTTESLVDALEQMHGVDLGVGATMNFGMSEHQASHRVWGTMIDAKGEFTAFDLE